MRTVRAVFFFPREACFSGRGAVSAGASTADVSVTLACSIVVAAGAAVRLAKSMVCTSVDVDSVDDSLVVEESEVAEVVSLDVAPGTSGGKSEGVSPAAGVVSSLGNEGLGAAPPTTTGGGSSAPPGPP